jgi:hypothetical protein
VGSRGGREGRGYHLRDHLEGLAGSSRADPRPNSMGSTSDFGRRRTDRRVSASRLASTPEHGRRSRTGRGRRGSRRATRCTGSGGVVGHVDLLDGRSPRLPPREIDFVDPRTQYPPRGALLAGRRSMLVGRPDVEPRAGVIAFRETPPWRVSGSGDSLEARGPGCSWAAGGPGRVGIAREASRSDLRSQRSLLMTLTVTSPACGSAWDKTRPRLVACWPPAARGPSS